MTSGVFVCFGGGLKVFVLQMGTGTWRVGEKRMEPGFFSVVPRDKTRGHRHALKHRRFPLNIRTPLFTVIMIEYWHSFPREVRESPSLDILKFVRSWSWATLGCLNRGVGQNDLQRSHPTSTVLQFCDLSPTLSLFSKRWCYPKTQFYYSIAVKVLWMTQ